MPGSPIQRRYQYTLTLQVRSTIILLFAFQKWRCGTRLRAYCTSPRFCTRWERIVPYTATYDETNHFNQESEQSSEKGADETRSPVNAPLRTLSPVPFNAMNKLSISTHPSYDFKSSKALDTTPTEDTRRAQGKPDASTMAPSATKDSRSLLSASPPTRQNSIQLGNGLTRTISSEFGPTRAYSNTNLPTTEENPESPSASSWSAAVGKANLGKSGRVIERLMGENDMLKRDLNIERLRAEESNQAAKMAEAKMEAQASEYETRLHDAAVNKMLLKRRERQVTDFKAQVELERQRTATAVESERQWRAEMEKCQEDCKNKVDEAQLYAAMMEGRNKSMTSHWADQRAEVDRAVVKMDKKIKEINLERRKDDEKITMLRSLCDQQAEQLRLLELEKEGINTAFEAYKKQQEDMLRDIKTKTAAREEKNAEILKESERVLGQLKWALAVKKNVKGAQ